MYAIPPLSLHERDKQNGYPGHFLDVLVANGQDGLVIGGKVSQALCHKGPGTKSAKEYCGLWATQ